MATIGELFVQLGFIADTKQAEQFDKKIKQVAKNAQNAVGGAKNLTAAFKSLTSGMGLVVTAVAGAMVAMDRLTDSLVKQNQTWINFERTTNLSLKTLQGYAGVAGIIDKSLGAEGAAGSIAQLNKRLFELRLTGQGAHGFQLAGINPMGQNAFGVLEQLRSRLKGVDDDTASYLLEQMGLDTRLLPMLRMTRKEFEEYQAVVNRYTLSPQQRKDIDEMNRQLEIASIRLRYLKDRAVLALMPVWTKFITTISYLIERFIKMGQFLGTVIKQLINLPMPLKNVAIAIGLIVAALKPAIGYFSILYLIIDDLLAYFNGGGSLFGVFMYNLEKYIEELKEKFGDDLTFAKVFPEVTIDITKLIIKASNIILDLATGKGGLLHSVEQFNYNNLKDIQKNRPSWMNDKQWNELNEQIKDYERKGYKEEMATDPFGIFKGIGDWLNNGKLSRAVNNTSTHNDNKQISFNQDIEITTNQPATDIYNELLFARNAVLT